MSGRTVLWVTHNLGLARLVSHSVVVLSSDGTVNACEIGSLSPKSTAIAREDDSGEAVSTAVIRGENVEATTSGEPPAGIERRVGWDTRKTLPLISPL